MRLHGQALYLRIQLLNGFSVSFAFSPLCQLKTAGIQAIDFCEGSVGRGGLNVIEFSGDRRIAQT